MSNLEIDVLSFAQPGGEEVFGLRVRVRSNGRNDTKNRCVNVPLECVGDTFMFCKTISGTIVNMLTGESINVTLKANSENYYQSGVWPAAWDYTSPDDDDGYYYFIGRAVHETPIKHRVSRIVGLV